MRAEYSRSSLCLLMIFVVAVALAGIVNAAEIRSPSATETRSSFTVVPIRYDPYPAESGRYVHLWIKVENRGTSDEHNARFMLDASYPFSLDTSGANDQVIGTIETGRQVVLEYSVRVDALALTGEYNNSLWLKQCYDSACATYTQFPISVYVRRPNPILSIASVAASPSPVAAGKGFNLALTLSNAGSRVKDVVFSLNLTSMPFVPSEAAASKQIASIDAGQNATLSFSLIATSSAKADTYRMPVDIEYSDEVGNSFSKSDYVTVIVGGRPEIRLNAEDSSIFTRDSTVEFVISIVNSGVVDAKFLAVRILPGDYRILSPDELYIGKLDSDDYETAKFKINIGSGSSGQLVIPFQLAYTDALNNQYNETKQVAYAVLTKDDAVRYGLAQPEMGWVYLVIFAALVLYAVYRLKWKKKQK